MKVSGCLLATLALSLSLAACTKYDSDKEADKTVQKILNEPLGFEPGAYQVSTTCGESGKDSSLPKMNMTYNFRADGSYIEDVKVLEPDCAPNCEFVVTGTYKATKTKFVFNQRSVAPKGSARFENAEERKVFDVLGYVRKSGQIILGDKQLDNACGGKMLWIMVKL